MRFRCSRCHHPFEADKAVACPNCKAEAGLEAERPASAPMRLFAILLGAVIVAAIGGGLLSRMAG